MNYQRETFEEVCNDIIELLPTHSAEVENLPMDANMMAYEMADAAGNTVIWTARDDDNKLVAYALFWIAYHPHHKSTLFATADLLYVLPEYRGGQTAWELMHSAEWYLRQRGVDVIAYTLKTEHDHPVLMETQGYIHTEKVYTKVL